MDHARGVVAFVENGTLQWCLLLLFDATVGAKIAPAGNFSRTAFGYITESL
jgi:hypothetical protein